MFGLFLMWDVGFVSCGTWGLFHAGRGVCLMWGVGFVSCRMWGLSHAGCGVCGTIVVQYLCINVICFL